MTTREDILILGGGLVLVWLLSRQSSPGGVLTLQAAPQLQQQPAICDGEGCPAASTATQQNPTLPQVPQWFLDKLAQFTQALNASNLAGTWETSWKIAAERDSWVASQGLLPTQWEAYV